MQDEKVTLSYHIVFLITKCTWAYHKSTYVISIFLSHNANSGVVLIGKNIRDGRIISLLPQCGPHPKHISIFLHYIRRCYDTVVKDTVLVSLKASRLGVGDQITTQPSELLLFVHILPT